MKIYISEKIDKAIEGFRLIPVVYGEIDLSSVPDNAASTVVAIDAIDSISYNKLEEFIAKVCSKLRLNGTVYLGGLDAYATSRNLLSGAISIQDFNDQIAQKGGIYSSKHLLDLLQKHQLFINSVIYKGNYYEITAQRKHSQN